MDGEDGIEGTTGFTSGNDGAGIDGEDGRSKNVCEGNARKDMITITNIGNIFG